MRRNKRPFAEKFATTSKSFSKNYSKAESKVQGVLHGFSNTIDFILFNDKYGKLVAVVLATIGCLIVNYGVQGNIFTNNMKTSLELQNIEVVSNASTSVYEVSGLPTSVDVLISGDTNEVQYASQQTGNYQVLANIKDLGEGTHEIQLEGSNFPSKVEVTIKPSTVIVTVQKKISRSFTLGYDYININKMDKRFVLSTPEFDENEVIVRASEETMANIAYVKALISVEGKRADFEEEVPVYAYSNEGIRLDVDIVPNTLKAKVKITSPQKEVPISLLPQGELNGQSIDSYNLSTDKITLYAPQDVLDEITTLNVVLPSSKLQNKITITLPITLPQGVQAASETTLGVTLTLDKSVTKTFDVEVKTKGLIKGLSVKNSEILTQQVEVTGTKKVIDELKSSDIELTMDLSAFDSAGTYETTLVVHGKQILATYKLKETKIVVTLEGGQ